MHSAAVRITLEASSRMAGSVLSRYTALPLPIVYLFVNGVDLLKCIIGFILVKKGVWVNNIVASSQDVPQAD